MKKLITIFLMSAICFSILLASEKTYGDIVLKKENIIKVYDGDTFYVRIPKYPAIIGENIAIRIDGIDTPEIRSQLLAERQKAHMARNFVLNKLMCAKSIVLKNIKRDKYFRIDADVFVDGKNIADILVEEKLGYRYDGGTKEKFEDGIKW